jgi:hypothetical protein
MPHCELASVTSVWTAGGRAAAPAAAVPADAMSQRRKCWQSLHMHPVPERPIHHQNGRRQTRDGHL